MSEHPARLLARLEARARKRFGQHFLVSERVVGSIVAAAQVGEGSQVLEIGPGLGVLTAALIQAGARVTAVELDRDMVAFLHERFAAELADGRLRLVQADAAAVEDWSALLPGGGWSCVANLPYNVGTRIVIALLRRPDVFRRVVVMLQREVAERMLAPVGDRGRGSLSVLTQARAQVRLALRVKPGSFHPPPKVGSAVIDLQLRPQPLPAGIPPEQVERVARAAFSAPRKAVRNGLSGTWPRARVDAALQAAGVSPLARPAALDLDALGRLALSLVDS